MKKIIALVFSSLAIIADSESIPATAVVVSTETVTKTVSREPRMIVLQFSTADGSVSADVSYETVTRVGGVVVASAPFKSVSLTWQQITNLVPALSASLEQFKAAAKASMTNTP